MAATFFTDATTEDLVAALPSLAVPKASPAVASARVVIVGGSIGGLAAAACLRAAGFKHVRVVERSHNVQPGAGIGLDDASAAVLKGLGVLGSGNGGSDASARSSEPALCRMRWTEERLACGTVLLRQPFPGFAIRYSELLSSLEGLLPEGTVTRGYKVSQLKRQQIQPTHNSSATGSEESPVLVHLEAADQSGVQHFLAPLECDVVIAADGPRSSFRSQLITPASPASAVSARSQGDSDLRYAGYVAWRGTITAAALPQAARDALASEYPHCGNCLYFIHGRRSSGDASSSTTTSGDGIDTNANESGSGDASADEENEEHAVLYDIGGGVLNWLVYSVRPTPVAAKGRTTLSAPPQLEVDRFKQRAVARWGAGLGALIAATPQPFCTDVYDLRVPLSTFVHSTEAAATVAVEENEATMEGTHPAKSEVVGASGANVADGGFNFALLGDAAHPVTPHLAKGSNLAICDAFALAAAAKDATSLPALLRQYSSSRCAEGARVLLLARHLGILRNGQGSRSSSAVPSLPSLPPLPRLPPCNCADTLVAQVKNAGLPTRTLPIGGAFEDVWDWVKAHSNEEEDDQKEDKEAATMGTQAKRGFFLERHENAGEETTLITEAVTAAARVAEGEGSASPLQSSSVPIPPPPPLDIVELNHVSLETRNVAKLVDFYEKVLGLPRLPRPDFGFRGAWFKLGPNGVQLHIIERDPLKPPEADTTVADSPSAAETAAAAAGSAADASALLPSSSSLNSSPSASPTLSHRAEERFIRRSHHLALTVANIDDAKARLEAHQVPFATNAVPNTDIVQLFLYDCDGNGVEIGNFNAGKS